MQIIVNGQRRECDAVDLAELWRSEIRDAEGQLSDMEYSKVKECAVRSTHGYAIALNGAVVRRNDWAKTIVKEGDRIEIVRAVQGG